MGILDWVYRNPKNTVLALTRPQIEEAFALAYLLLGDRDVALKVLKKALAKWADSLDDEERRRLEYKPKRIHSKTILSAKPPQVLQLCIYEEALNEEKVQERNAPEKLTETDMIFRYIKHLVFKSFQLPFRAVVGMSRLLYHYPTEDALAIYHELIRHHAPQRGARDADNCRHEKKDLMDELERRFDQRLRLVKVMGPRGEDRFEALDNSYPYWPLVRQFLNQFLNQFLEKLRPWDVSCERDQSRPDVNLLHSIFCPDCFRASARALNLGFPETSLELPKFLLVSPPGNGNNDSDLPWLTQEQINDRLTPAALTDEEISGVIAYLDTHVARRNRLRPDVLRVFVDAEERACFCLVETDRVAFDLEQEAGRIEVVACDEEGDLVLAARWLAMEGWAEAEPGAKPRTSSYTLAAGQQVRVSIARSEVPGRLRAEIAYRERAPLRAFSLWQRRRAAASSSVRPPRVVGGRRQILIGATGLFVGVVAGWGLRAGLAPPEPLPLGPTRGGTPSEAGPPGSGLSTQEILDWALNPNPNKLQDVESSVHVAERYLRAHPEDMAMRVKLRQLYKTQQELTKDERVRRELVEKIAEQERLLEPLLREMKRGR